MKMLLDIIFGYLCLTESAYVASYTANENTLNYKTNENYQVDTTAHKRKYNNNDNENIYNDTESKINIQKRQFNQECQPSCSYSDIFADDGESSECSNKQLPIQKNDHGSQINDTYNELKDCSSSIVNTYDNTNNGLYGLIDQCQDMWMEEVFGQSNDKDQKLISHDDDKQKIHDDLDKINLESLKYISDMVRIKGKMILGRIKNQSIRLWYENRFHETEKIFNTYKTINLKEIASKYINYNSLDKNIHKLLFDITNSETEVNKKLILSEPKFTKFLSMSGFQIYTELFINMNFGYELLIIIEFHNLQKHYNEFPELLVLDRVRINNLTKSTTVFYYLRSLNVLLNYFEMNKGVHSDYKDKIILFIQNIIISTTQIYNCDMNPSNLAKIFISPCGKLHETLYLPILSYCLHFVSRNNLFGGYVKNLQKSTKSYHIKTCSLYLLYNHLLLNIYLGRQQYDAEKIENFITNIDDENVCIGCFMEDCINLVIYS